jgi:hypothetical protein
MKSGEIIDASWRGTSGAVRANARLFLGVILAVLVVYLAAFFIYPVHYVQKLTSSGHLHMVPDMPPLQLDIRNFVLAALANIASTPMMLATHRHVLLQEDGKIWKNFQRIASFAAALIILHFLLMELPISATVHKVPGVVVFIFASYWLMGRLVLIYPAIALDIPQPLSVSWRHTRGHWWLVARVMVFGLAPLFLLMIPFAAVYGASTPANISEHLMIMNIAGALLGAFFPVLAAALASELFRKFGGVPAQA